MIGTGYYRALGAHSSEIKWKTTYHKLFHYPEVISIVHLEVSLKMFLFAVSS